MLQFKPCVHLHISFEFNAGKNKNELEIYIGGYFLCSVNIADISKEAQYYLFQEKD